MNAKLIFLAIVLVLAGAIIAIFLTGSGKEFYRLVDDGPGAELYQSNCAKCHGTQGEGVASYADIRKSKRSKAEILKLISKGSGEMPAFPDFSESELNLLVEYVLEL